MEMRIVVTDGATALAGRLTMAFGADRISTLGDREVDVRVEGDSDRTVLGVLDTVDSWLDQAAVGSAEIWLGENSYRVARWAPVEVSQ
jgi:hypothetical protein